MSKPFNVIPRKADCSRMTVFAELLIGLIKRKNDEEY